MNVMVNATRKIYTGLDATLASVLSDCGMVTVLKPERRVPFTRGAIAAWLKETFKVRPSTQVAYAAAERHFKPAPAFMKLRTAFGNESEFNNRVRFALLSAFGPSGERAPNGGRMDRC
jgi:hypothetical protein